MRLSITSRSGIAPAARNDDQPAIGNLRPWTRQKAEAERRVNERKNHRAAEIKAKKLEQDKVHAQTPLQRRADKKVVQAERETTAQLGKVFAALSMSAPKTAGGLCKDLPKLLKPATDRDYIPLAGGSKQDRLEASEQRYQDWLGDLATQSLKKMTAAELQSVANGLDGTHFSSDALEVFVIHKAVAKECERRRPQPEAAKNACVALGRGELAKALGEMRTARGDKEHPLDWNQALVDAELKESELMAILEQFMPDKSGKESDATQVLGSLAHVAKGPMGKDHPQARQAPLDMAAITKAAWDLLSATGRHQPKPLHNAEEHVKNAVLSDDANVRAALRQGLGIVIAEGRTPIAAHDKAAQGAGHGGLASMPARNASRRDAVSQRPAVNGAERLQPMDADQVLAKRQAALKRLDLADGYSKEQLQAAKFKALKKADGAQHLRDEVADAAELLEQPRLPVNRALPLAPRVVQPNAEGVALNQRAKELPVAVQPIQPGMVLAPAQDAGQPDAVAQRPAVDGAERLPEAERGIAKRRDALALLGLDDNYTKEQFEAAKYHALGSAAGDSEALFKVGKAIELLDLPRPPLARALPLPPRVVQPDAQSVAFNQRVLNRPVEGQPLRPVQRLTQNQFKADVVLDAANNPIYVALKQLAEDGHNGENLEFLEQAAKYRKGQMKDWEREAFGVKMQTFVEDLLLSSETKKLLKASLMNQWNGFEVALAAAVKEVQADVMKNTFEKFLAKMADGTSSLRGAQVGIAQRYLQGLAPIPAAQGPAAGLQAEG